MILDYCLPTPKSPAALMYHPLIDGRRSPIPDLWKICRTITCDLGKFVPLLKSGAIIPALSANYSDDERYVSNRQWEISLHYIKPYLASAAVFIIHLPTVIDLPTIIRQTALLRLVRKEDRVNSGPRRLWIYDWESSRTAKSALDTWLKLPSGPLRGIASKNLHIIVDQASDDSFPSLFASAGRHRIFNLDRVDVLQSDPNGNPTKEVNKHLAVLKQMHSVFMERRIRFDSITWQRMTKTYSAVVEDRLGEYRVSFPRS